MGVPKFFRWISERYPCISVSVEKNQIPYYDCLYLDMNGIIHICSHPDDTNVHFRISESDIFNNIFNYIEFLFKTVKPKDIFFLAVDGVAPRAKMNQQRSRRFKSAKEALNREMASVKNGVKLPDEKRFDSNCITPGTEFMDRLQKALQSFLEDKIKNDSLWQGVDVILSGHEAPGEGEHKIQEFIRFRRSLPNYNPNTRHCLYGLDADLMLLGLASHEPYFSLLREEVIFSKNKAKRAYIAEETKFFLLHLSLLREYIDYEFNALKNTLGSEYSLERIIDDWIVMSFLVGNDFVPHLPNLHIHTSALPFLWETYIKIRPQMKGYINDCGKLNLESLLQYIDALTIFDRNIFLEYYEDMKWMLGKTGERIGNELQNLDKRKTDDSQKESKIVENNMNEIDISLSDFFQSNTVEFVKENVEDCKVEISVPDEENNFILEIDGNTAQNTGNNEIRYDNEDLVQLDLITQQIENIKIDRDFIEFDIKENEKIVDGVLLGTPDENECEIENINEDEDEKEIWKIQYSCYKRNYYFSKIGLIYSDEMLIDQANQYITALQWISYYYFCGVPSWSWFYPQHYAPFLSDLSNLDSNLIESGINFDYGQPFMPFQQLMAVLPSYSCELLPYCFQDLMKDKVSSIIDFYPESFQSDLNGKKKDWEAVILIPFIDENRLIEAMNAKISFLTPSELQRNVHSGHLKYRFSNDHLIVTELNHDFFRISKDSIVTGLCSGVRLDVICQGFPTFNHIDHTFVLEKVGVKIFEFCANSNSILLQISPPTESLIIDIVAQKFIDKIAYVNWPAFIEVKIVAVLSETTRYKIDSKSKNVIGEPLDTNDIEKMKIFKKNTTKNLFVRSAIAIDKNDFIILESFHSEGKSYKISGTHKAGSTVRLEHNWDNSNPIWHLHQLSILKESIDVLQSNSKKIITKLNQLLPKNGIVFSLDKNYYGRSGKVVSINNCSATINIQLDQLNKPIFDDINLNSIEDEYMNATIASGFIDMNPLLFSRITGTLYIHLSNSQTDDHRPKKGDRNKTDCSIGLDLKNNKLNLNIPGWVVKTKNENSCSTWLYSMKVVEVLEEYRLKFPEVFQFINKPNFEKLSVADIFDKENLLTKVTELGNFLNNLPHRNIERIGNNSEIVSESNICILQKSLERQKFDVVESEQIELGFYDIYRPHYSLDGVKPDKSTKFKLLDRVVCSTDSYTVPLGLRGTVIGKQIGNNSETRLEILFDKEFKSAISIRQSQSRCYRMPEHTLINITHGLRRFGHIIENELDIKLKPNNHQKEKKRENYMTEVNQIVINNLLTSELNCSIDNKDSNFCPPTVLPTDSFSKSSTPLKRQSKQRDFIAHCNKIFIKKNNSNLNYFEFTIKNCSPEYYHLFTICQKSGIHDPKVMERHVDDGVYIRFTSSFMSLPEVKETSIGLGRANTIKRIWNLLFNHIQPADYTGYNNQYNNHLFIPSLFNNNPFMQSFTHQSQIPFMPQIYNSTKTNMKTVVNVDKSELPSPKICENNFSIKKSANNRNQRRHFIRTPKPKSSIFK